MFQVNKGEAERRRLQKQSLSLQERFGIRVHWVLAETVMIQQLHSHNSGPGKLLDTEGKIL